MFNKIFRYRFVLGIMSFVIFAFATNSEGGEPEIQSYISQPDELVIYEGDIAYAKDTAQIDTQDTIQVELPSSAILRTLVIYDGGKRVQNFNSSAAEISSQPSLSGFGYDDGTLISSKICTSAPIILSTQKKLVTWRTNIKGNRQVLLEYLINGIGWSPVYNLDILGDKKATFLYKALIDNNAMPMEDVKIKLASGMVGKPQMNPPSSYHYDSKLPPELATLYDILIDSRSYATPSSRISADYTNELGKLSLNVGTNFIELSGKELEYEKEFIWAIFFGQRADVHYAIKNSSKETFAQGSVYVFQNGLYLGSDQIQITQPGGEANITFCGIRDIKVDKIVNVTNLKDRRYKKNYHEIELKVENLTDKEIKIKIFDIKYPDCEEMESNIKPINLSGNALLWEMSVLPNGTKSLRYGFFSDNTYKDPYQLYY